MRGRTVRLTALLAGGTIEEMFPRGRVRQIVRSSDGAAGTQVTLKAHHVSPIGVHASPVSVLPVITTFRKPSHPSLLVLHRTP